MNSRKYGCGRCENYNKKGMTDPAVHLAKLPLHILKRPLLHLAITCISFPDSIFFSLIYSNDYPDKSDYTSLKILPGFLLSPTVKGDTRNKNCK